MQRNFAGWVTHHWTKWVILALSLGLIMVMGSLGAKLTSVQENDISSWLPGQRRVDQGDQQVAASSPILTRSPQSFSTSTTQASPRLTWPRPPLTPRRSSRSSR